MCVCIELGDSPRRDPLGDRVVPSLGSSLNTGPARPNTYFNHTCAYYRSSISAAGARFNQPSLTTEIQHRLNSASLLSSECAERRASALRKIERV